MLLLVMTAKELEKKVIHVGWFFVRQNGSHKIYKHNLPKGTFNSILKKSALK